jgi:CheY-like chemotaxis protein
MAVCALAHKAEGREKKPELAYSNRRSLGLALIEAKAVGTAAQALSMIQTERFDLYLLDGWLPGLDGFELCRQLRAFDPHTPILFFSGARLMKLTRTGGSRREPMLTRSSPTSMAWSEVSRS